MPAAAANELSTQLWRQREILDLLLFKHVERRLLLDADEERWLPQADREIRNVIARLQEATLSLSVSLADVAGEWGLPATTRLTELAASAPSEVWRELLHEHAHTITELIADIRSAAGTDASGDADHTRVVSDLIGD